jgi:hypothetical protein
MMQRGLRPTLAEAGQPVHGLAAGVVGAAAEADLGGEIGQQAEDAVVHDPLEAGSVLGQTDEGRQAQRPGVHRLVVTVACHAEESEQAITPADGHVVRAHGAMLTARQATQGLLAIVCVAWHA